jgi:hypothetical protein
MLFSGRCIGGPLDGEWTEAQVPTIRIPKIQEFEFWASPFEPITGPPQFEYHVYEYKDRAWWLTRP